MRGRRGRAVLLAGLCALLAGCAGTPGAGPATGAPSSPAATSPSTPPPATTRPTPAGGVPVWFVGPTPAGDRLFRERRAIVEGGPDGAAADPVGLAVRTMLAGRAQDPDYRTDWPAGVTLRGPVRHDDGMFTVDLAVPAARQGPAGLALEQLVRTVQDAAGSVDPVRVQVDGRPATTLLGEPVSAPLTAGDPYAVRSLVQIDDPAEGAPVGSPLTVSGEAAVFEATLLWEVRDRTGRVVVDGFATTAEGQRFAPYRFPVQVAPGDYVLVVSEDDPSGGAGRAPMTDTKTITVR